MTHLTFPPARRHVFLAMSLIGLASLPGCYVENRAVPPNTAHLPTGGKLPADIAVDQQFGGPTFTGETRPAAGAIKAY